MTSTTHSVAHDHTISVETCRAQLVRVLESADFDGTPRERRFLKYVVDETLEGRGARIKAYSVATEVFERDSDFDPQNDPIVRIEAGRLRRALERYYLTAGVSDALVITIPKGGYVPVFAMRDVPQPIVVAEASNPPLPPQLPRADPQPRRLTITWYGAVGLALCILTLAIILAYPYDWLARAVSPSKPEIPRVVVERFENLGGDGMTNDIANGLTQEVISKLSRFRDITVVESEVEGAIPARYALRGSVSLSLEGFLFRVRLLQRSDDVVLWAHDYDGNLSATALVQAQSDIADKVVAILAQVDGVIFKAESRDDGPASPESWVAYRCTLSFYAMRATMNARMIPEVKACLERTVAEFPDYATAWALLALCEMDALRSKFPFDAATARPLLERVFEHARRATDLDPQNVRGLQAELLGRFYGKQFEAGKTVGERAMDLNPNDGELMNEFGYSLALSGNWQDGCKLIRRAHESKGVQSRYQENGLVLCAYFEGDIAKARSLINMVPTRGRPMTLLLAMIVYAETGDTDGVERVRAELQDLAPSLLENARIEVAMRLGRTEDVDRVMRSLQKAGLLDTVGEGTF